MTALFLALTLMVGAAVTPPAVPPDRDVLSRTTATSGTAAPVTFSTSDYQFIGIVVAGSVAQASADCDAGPSNGPVWAGVTGTQFLDIIQIGAYGDRYFASWGNGVPNGEGSSWETRDLGPSTPGPHRYTVWLKGSTWWLYIDGKVRVLVPDGFRTWDIKSRQIIAEVTGPDEHFGNGTWCRTRLGSGWGGAVAGPDAMAFPQQPIMSHGRTVGFRLGVRTVRASWYCGSGSTCSRSYPASGAYAAAGPDLARVGDRLRVCTGAACVTVRVIDRCSVPVCLDLYSSQFRRLAPLSAGRVTVTVTVEKG